jgi:hypothetical protein
MANSLGVHRATVINTVDPQGLGRLLLSSTRIVKGSQVQVQGWAAVGAAPLGAFVTAIPIFVPGDTVLYAAEKLPFDGAVVLCLAGSRAVGAGLAEWSINLSLGQGKQAIVEASRGELQIRTPAGPQITLQADGTVSVMASAQLSVSAAQVHVAASMVTVDAGVAKFSGAVQCDTLIATTVVASSYTPGAGNLS